MDKVRWFIAVMMIVWVPPAVAGTQTVNAKAGLATFSALKLTRAGGYTLSASSEGLSGAAGPA